MNRIEKIVHCPNCKKEINANADVCKYCGFSMSNYRLMLLKQEAEKRNINKTRNGQPIEKATTLQSMYDTGKGFIAIMYILTAVSALVTAWFYSQSAREVSEGYTIMVLQPTIFSGIGAICTILLLITAIILQVLRNMHLKKSIMLDVLIAQTKKDAENDTK